jgi:hypothetical protein
MVFSVTTGRRFWRFNPACNLPRLSFPFCAGLAAKVISAREKEAFL